MYAAFVDSLPVVVSLWQSGFYNLIHGKTIKTYQDAWAVVHGPKEQ